MKQKTVLAGTILLITSLAFPKTTSAQDVPYYRDQVIGYLQRSATYKYLMDHGYRTLENGLKTGYIYTGSGHFQDAEYYLESGYTYAFAGACDEDCKDMDFVLYDPDGNKVASDTEPDDHPLVGITARVNGTYTVRATMPKCDAPIGCYWAIQAFGK